MHALPPQGQPAACERGHYFDSWLYENSCTCTDEGGSYYNYAGTGYNCGGATRAYVVVLFVLLGVAMCLAGCCERGRLRFAWSFPMRSQ